MNKSLKEMFTQVLNALPQGGVQSSWVYLKMNGYVICAQQFNLTPSAANTTTTRSVTLPFTMANTTYYVMVTLNSQPEVTTCHVSGLRDTTTAATLSIYASNTTTRSVFCLIFGKLA